MGCKASKAAEPVRPASTTSKSQQTKRPSKRPSSTKSKGSSTPRNPAGEALYNALVKAQSSSISVNFAKNILPLVKPESAKYQHATTLATPLHAAVQLVSTTPDKQLCEVVRQLLQLHSNALFVKDSAGNIPLHYVIGPKQNLPLAGTLLLLLVRADPTSHSTDYLARNNVCFGDDKKQEYSPLYYALWQLPDDLDLQGPTVTYMETLLEFITQTDTPNATDGDTPLALLYRRFTRQFDLAEKFFAGDNSRPTVVNHRRQYKTAAGNTWKLIETLLVHPSSTTNTQQRLVHAAVQHDTPPDLLRYLVETHADDLMQPEPETGRLPLHYAAASNRHNSKYVMDELLYKYPDAARVQDKSGKYPLFLAVNNKKEWIAGGIKSLYDAFPTALEQVDLEQHVALQKALSMDQQIENEEKKRDDTIVQDEPHDAIMLVQKRNVSVAEVVSSMWAHEEDAGVQMLGCVALVQMMSRKKKDVLRIALSAVPAVVNAMKAHPNEVIVQEKACLALKGMSSSDGKREVSFVASGAVAAIVGAMQAHVSDAGVQEHACGAIAQIIRYGGEDRATIVASVSGLTAIVNALAAHPTVVGVQRDGCEALKELTEFPHANLPELPRSQVEPLLETAREKYPVECRAFVNVLLSRMSVES